MKKLDTFLLNTIDWCFHVLLFVTPLLFTWFNEELFEFNKMLFVYGISLIVGGLWLARMVIRRQFVWKKTIFDIPIGLFILSQLLSTLFSIHPETSIFGYYTRFHGGLLSTLAYTTLFAVFVQSIQPKKVWRYLQTVAWGSLFVSAVAIPEHFGRSLSCVFINSSHLSETQSLAAVLNPQQLWNSYNAQCWVQDVQNRVFATFGQPNWLAAYAITLLPVFAVLSAIRKNKEQWLYAAATIALFLDLLFTKSRSGILGLAAGAAWFAGVFAVWQFQRAQKKQPVHFHSFKMTGVIVLILCVLAVFFGTPYTPSLTQALQKEEAAPAVDSAPSAAANRLELGGTDSGEIRKIVWTGAVDIWKKYPVFGSGVETFAYSYNFARPMAHNHVSEWDFLYNKAHNEFLNFLATTGAVGLLCYLILLTAFIGFPVVLIFKNRTLTPELAVFFLSLSSGIVGLTVSNALGFSTVMVAVLLFLYPAIVWVLHQPETALPAQKKIDGDQELSVRDKLWVGVIGLTVLVGLVLIWRTWRADNLFAKGKLLNQRQEYADGVEALERAHHINNESIFAEELSETYSLLSSAFDQAGQATPAAAYRVAAEQKANEIIENNPYNLNFYKTRTRVLAALSPQDPQLLIEAKKTLEAATQLAPTDPKVRYNLGLVKFTLGEIAETQADFEQAVEMKPNYEEARMSLARLYDDQDQPQKALDQYIYILEKIQPENEVAQQEVKRLEAVIATASAKTKK